MKHLSKTLSALALAFGLSLSACNSPQPKPELAATVAASAGPTCYSFDNLTLGQFFHDDEVYNARKADIYFHEYLFNGGTYYKGGAHVSNSTIVNNTPPSLGFLSMVAEFVPHTPAQSVSFLYAEVLQGVHANFDVNGSGVQEYPNLAALNGLNIGGVDIAVTVTVTGGKQTGTLTLTANPTPISSFKFGGRNLSIDDFCHE